ncbi:S8 family serine peptidase [Limibacter armeniacum]|uniref:S8 family serine peptidase n=1 Tax=Limibacter armeniacum TaxID=466084 RepID=UPI002FE60273
MKQLLSRTLRGWLTIIALLLSLGAIAQKPVTYSNGVAKGVIRVKFKEDPGLAAKGFSIGGAVQLGVTAFDAKAAKYEARNMKRVFPYDPKTEGKARKHGLHLWYEMEIDGSISAKASSQDFSSLASVERAEPIYEKKMIGNGTMRPLTMEEVAAMAAEEELPTDDPYLEKQWHYHNSAQASGWVEGADINLFEAWKKTAGASNIIVSIHDEGVDVNHEDLAANMWVNEGEIAGNGIDDDGNGYIDDAHGYSFSYDQGEIVAQDHGTHVAGTVAAVNNNGIGVAGVAGGTGNNDGVRLMSCQILSGTVNNVAASYKYAADNGAVISQNSWGYTNPDVYEQSVLDAIDYFIDEAGDYEGSPMKGGIVIFAAGNSNDSGAWYPGYYDRILTVASTGPSNQKAYYSNYGSWVDITAPGGDTSLKTEDGVLSTTPNNTYAYMQGTSMACPHVSGIAALVVAQLGGPDFTAEQLWNQLVVSTHSLDDYNPSYVGKLGAGLVDAAMAIEANEGIAPDAVADLAVSSIAHDFAILNWTTPADEDDEQATSFQILYSTSPITAENAAAAQKVLMTDVSALGELNTFEVTGLNPETTYYFAVRGQDRWGNVAALSNVLEASTNKGPLFVADKTDFTAVIDASVSTEASDMVTISNEGEGLLRWSYENKQVDFNFSTSSVKRADFPQVATRSLEASNIGRTPTNRVPLATLSEEELNEFTSSEKYYASLYAWYNIGDEDTSLPNSSATLYEVNEEEGFNLTDIRVWLANDDSNGAVVVEIYKGAVKPENLVHTQEHHTPSEGVQYITLDEHIYFPQGSSFYVIIHAPVGNKYPLGMSPVDDWEVAYNKMYMSFDFGQSWYRMQDAVGEEGWGWSMSVASYKPYLGTYVTLDPATGEVNEMESQEVAVNVDASKLINGDYTSNVLFKTNDLENGNVRLPLSLTVSGHQPELRSQSVVDFGSVFVGAEKEMEIEILNFGYGNFNVESVEVSGDQFEWTQETWDFTQVAARARKSLKIAYKPTVAGNANSVVTLTDANGNVYNFNLFGVAAVPSEITLSPATQSFDLAAGETTTGTVTVENTGAYPLSFTLPKFAETEEGVHKHGYSWSTNMHDASIEWNWTELDGDADAIDISAYFEDADSEYHLIDLGFEFPFYNQRINQIYVSKHGALTLDTHSTFNISPPPLGRDDMPYGFIFGTGYRIDLSQGGKVLYKQLGDSTIIEFKDVVSFSEAESYQFVLHANGDFDIKYDHLSASEAPYYTISFEDPDKLDGIMIKNSVMTEEARNFFTQTDDIVVRVKSPGENIVSAPSATQGAVQPGESMDIDFTVNTEDLLEGANTQRVTVFSNDPNQPYASFEVVVNMTGGVADLQISEDSLGYGEVFQGDVDFRILELRNAGSKSISITSSVFANDYFTLDTATYELKPRRSQVVKVNLVTDAQGVFEDVLTLTDSEGDTYEVKLTAEVVAAPAIAVDTTPIVETLNAGEKATHTITIDNTAGEATLEVLPMGNSWLYAGEEATTAAAGIQIDEFTYAMKDNKALLAGGTAEDAPVYRWYDLPNDGGTHVEIGSTFWEEVSMPFAFNFYGKEYDKLYLTYNGLISLEPQTYIFITGGRIPDETIPNNIIAPIWMMGDTDYFDLDETKGIWYKEYDDKVVITYHRMQHSWAFLGGYVSAQVIIYNNGVIKMQYKADATSATWSSRATVGIENEDGTNGVETAFGVPYIEDGLAVTYTPAKKITVAAGETKDITLTVDAAGLLGGSYEGGLLLKNNTPQNNDVTIPVSLTVNGTSEVIASEESFEFGEVMQYTTTDEWGTSAPVAYELPFSLQNDGTALASLTEMILTNSSADIAVYQKSINPFWGNVEWVDINWLVWPMELNAGDREEFKVVLTPTAANAAFADTLNVTTDGGQLIRMPISAVIQLPPVLAVDTDSMSVIANSDDHTETQSFVIDNTAGESALKYELQIDYNRIQDASVSAYNQTYVASATASLGKVELASVAKASVQATNETYNNILEYDQNESASNALGYGGNSFTSVTGFTAPQAGFNLSHVKTWYRAEGMANAPITVEVRAGNLDPEKAVVVGVETFETETEGSVGSFLTLALSEPVKILPGERFFILLHYSLGVTYPQGVVELEESLPGTFYVPSEEGWFDLSTDASFATTAYVVKAMEATADTSDIWFTLDASAGEVPAGSSATVTATFTAANAIAADNIATINVVSNDPMNEVEDVVATMRINQAPVFTLGELSTHSVAEMDTLTVALTAADVEGNAFTFALADTNDQVTLAADGATATFTYAPDYESAGTQTFEVTATDEYGKVSIHTIEVNVANVNRVPVATETAPISIDFESKGVSLPLADIFVDEDGDEMTFTTVIAENTIAQAVLTGEELFVVPFNVGNTFVTVTATDSNGGTAEVNIEVVVTDVPLGLDDELASTLNLKNFPNPATANTTISYELPVNGQVTVEVFDFNGGKIATLVNAEQQAGQYEVTYQTAGLPAGMYIYALSIDGERVATGKLLKQ